MVGDRECKTCKITRPVTEFWASTYGIGGRRRVCKYCTKVPSKASKPKKPAAKFIPDPVPARSETVKAGMPTLLKCTLRGDWDRLAGASIVPIPTVPHQDEFVEWLKRSGKSAPEIRVILYRLNKRAYKWLAAHPETNNHFATQLAQLVGPAADKLG
jgi:hypothetical protein